MRNKIVQIVNAPFGTTAVFNTGDGYDYLDITLLALMDDGSIIGEFVAGSRIGNFEGTITRDICKECGELQTVSGDCPACKLIFFPEPDPQDGA
jgi:hypothetical protein